MAGFEQNQGFPSPEAAADTPWGLDITTLGNFTEHFDKGADLKYLMKNIHTRLGVN